MKAGEGASPSRTPGGRDRPSTSSRGPATVSRGAASSSKRPGAGVSPGPRGSPGPGRTPQTKRRELSLSVAVTEKNSPGGSPRCRAEEGSRGGRRGGGEVPRRKNQEREPGEGSRKSSNSSQDSGVSTGVRESGRPRNNNRRNPNPPTIRTASPEWVGESEVGERKKFGELSDVTNIELGIVKVPRELLDELIHKEPIEKYYTVDEVPVAR